jgi:molecular chaperone DnaK (HSP70)
MTRRDARYTVGIDLGTTNCVLARGDPEERAAAAAVDVVSVPQLQAPGEVVVSPLLPSFLYLPGPHELPEGSTDLPWGASAEGVVGEMARRRVAVTPDRVVHSAKSWLCHEGVDRTRPFLPRSQAELERRVSPVEASAAYLVHLRRAWDHLVARGERELALGAQDVLLTVPASFGEAARQLTVEAGRMAGLERIHIVEEPQAAFYAWLAAHSGKINEALEGLHLILVVDVGGGTTDLTLIRVTRADEDSPPSLERVAVGEHLMLGGDNMDLALAALAEPRLAKGAGAKLDGRAWQALRQSCRQARELLLTEDAPEATSVVIPGRGSSLVGGLRRTELSREEVVSTVLDQFFPVVGPGAEVERRQGLGLREWGLPYAQDVAVTRHVAEFMRRYRSEVQDQTPLDAVLFNGGVLNSAMVSKRLFEVVGSWTAAAAPAPRLLASRSLDLAVALGAAHYGLVRRGRGLRIVSGLPHAVYVGLEVRKKKRGGKRRLSHAALCLAPRGLQEGESVELVDRPLSLTVGRDVVFPLFSATGRGGKPGEVRSADDRGLEPLPPLRTRLPGTGKRQVPVTLRATLTEVGTLDVVAAAQDGSATFKLEFDMRGRADGEAAELDDADERGGPELGGLDPDRVEQATAILAAFFSTDAEPPKWKLIPRLEGVLKASREHWPLPTVRGFFEVLRPDVSFYTGPPEIQSTWYNLVGFCLRPGFGYLGDEARMELMDPVLKAGCRAWDPRTRAEWWVLWRRVAGGLDRRTQEGLFKSLLPLMGLGRGQVEIPVQSTQEMVQVWMLGASLERVNIKAKADWGGIILDELEAGGEKPKVFVPPEALWCLGRLGARNPVHGGIESVVPTDRVEGWLERLIALETVQRRDLYALALAILSRRTSDRSRDVDEALRARVIERLRSVKATTAWIAMVEQLVEDEPLGESVLGESLPPGLRLMA